MKKYNEEIEEDKEYYILTEEDIENTKKYRQLLDDIDDKTEEYRESLYNKYSKEELKKLSNANEKYEKTRRFIYGSQGIIGSIYFSAFASTLLTVPFIVFSFIVEDNSKYFIYTLSVISFILSVTLIICSIDETKNRKIAKKTFVDLDEDDY